MLCHLQPQNPERRITKKKKKAEEISLKIDLILKIRSAIFPHCGRPGWEYNFREHEKNESSFPPSF